MNILLVSSETSPFYKSGGLADVVYGFAKELLNQGHDARIVTPHYRNPLAQDGFKKVIDKLPVHLGESETNKSYSRIASVLRVDDPLRIYFIDQDYYFGRNDLYGYVDDYERFIFFTRATLTMLKSQEFINQEGGWFPDIIQGYDWQTGLMPIWMKKEKAFQKTRFVLYIHNLRRMGIFGSRALQLAGLEEDGYHSIIGEQRERVNFLGRGILFADHIAMTNPHFGEHNPLPKPAVVLQNILEKYLDEKIISSIQNGIDEEDEYNPGEDKLLFSQFKSSLQSLKGRSQNKTALQRLLNLPENESIPLVGLITRLTAENGLEILKDLAENRSQLPPFQLAIMAEPGVPEYFEMLESWENAEGTGDLWVKTRFQFEENLARLIYGGCDIFLMPAIENPSGIHHFIAMRYGAIPLAFHTGALVDSVLDYEEQSDLAALAVSGKGLGIKFSEPTHQALLNGLQRALHLYGDGNNPDWRSLQISNMRANFNWWRPTSEYIKMYKQVLSQPARQIFPGEKIESDRETRLIQAMIEVDNLPGLGARKSGEILKQSARILRSVLNCDAVYVWEAGHSLELTSQNVGNDHFAIVECSLDGQPIRHEPDREQVTDLLKNGVANSWRQLGDSDFTGIVQPIRDLNESSLARTQGWVAGRSAPVTSHGRLLGRVDLLFKKDISDTKWADLAVSALANSVGLRLSTVRLAREMDQIGEMAASFLDARTYEAVAHTIQEWCVRFTHAQDVYLYKMSTEGLLPVAEEKPHGLEIAQWIAADISTGNVRYASDWLLSPRGKDKRRFFRSILAIPLLHAGKVSGALAITHKEPRAFTRDDEEMLQSYLAPQAAAALASAGWHQGRDRQRAEQLEILSQSLVSGDYDTLLGKIVNSTMAVLYAEAASLYVMDETGENLSLQATAGYHTQLLNDEKPPVYKKWEGVTGAIAGSGEIFIADSTEDLHKNKAWKGKFKDRQNDREPNAFLGIPLKVDNKVIGVLKLEDRRKDAPAPTFSADDALLAKMMSNVIAAVVYNAQYNKKTLARLSQNLQQLSDVLIASQDRKSLMNGIVNKVAEVIDVDAASLYLLDPISNRLVVQAASGYQEILMKQEPVPSYAWGEGVTGRIAASNREFSASSVDDLREKAGGQPSGNYDSLYGNRRPNAFYGLPLKVASEPQAIGVLKFERLEQKPFNAEDKLLMHMMANVIAAVVFNADVSEKKLSSFSDNLKALSEVLATSQDRKSLMKEIVDTAAQVIGVDAASLYLFDAKANALVIQAASGYQSILMDQKPLPSYNWGSGVTGRIAQSNKPMQFDSVEQLRRVGDKKNGNYDHLYDYKRPESFYGVPLNVKNKDNAIGVLKFERLEKKPFGAEELLLIEMMANVIAAVVYNARVAEDKLAKFSQNLDRLANVLTESQDRKALMDSIVNKVAEVINVDAASLYLVDASSGNLVIQAASGYQKNLMEADPLPHYHIGEGVTGRIAKSNQAIHVDSLDQLRDKEKSRWGQWDHLQNHQRPQAFYGLPLNVSDRKEPIGVLKFERLQAIPFNDEDVLLIQMMGNVIATVIYNTNQGEERLGNVLRKMGPYSHAQDVSRDVLTEYISSTDSGLINQLASALAMDLDHNPIRTKTEAQALFDADGSQELFNRISSWAHNDRVKWQFNLYAAVLGSHTRPPSWHQIEEIASPWLALKDAAGDPEIFRQAAEKLTASLAERLNINLAKMKKADLNPSWFQAHMSTEHIFGEQVKNILCLLQSHGTLDENNQALVEKIVTRKKDYPVVMIVRWNTGVTSEQMKETGERLRKSSIDVIFASIADLLRIEDAPYPEDRFRNLILNQVRVVSPFVINGAVPESMFFGRDQEVKTLIADAATKDYAVIGNRKIGKTSLIRKVQSILADNPNIHPIAVNCQTVTNTDEFLNELSQEITLPEHSISGFRQAMQTLRGQGPIPVLLIDEVDALLGYDWDQKQPLTKIWRALSQNQTCHFIISGSKQLAHLLHDAESDIYNFTEELRLGYLSEEIASRLLMEPLERLEVKVEGREQITQKIYHITSGHPNLIQNIGKRLVDETNKRRSRLIQLVNVENLIESSDFTEIYLTTILGAARPLEQLVLFLAPGLDFSQDELEKHLVQKEILGVGKSYGKPSREDLFEALWMLERYSILDRNSKGKISFIPRAFLEILGRLQPTEIEMRINALVNALNRPNA